MDDTEFPVFKSSNDFSLHIEKLAAENHISYLDAVLLFCATHGVEPDDVAQKINKSLKDKLEQDFRDLNYLPKKAQIEM